MIINDVLLEMQRLHSKLQIMPDGENSKILALLPLDGSLKLRFKPEGGFDVYNTNTHTVSNLTDKVIAESTLKDVELIMNDWEIVSNTKEPEIDLTKNDNEAYSNRDADELPIINDSTEEIPKKDYRKKLSDEVLQIDYPEQFAEILKEREEESKKAHDLMEQKRLEDNLKKLEALENGDIKKPVTKSKAISQPARKSVPASKALTIPDAMRSMQISELTPEDIVKYLCRDASEKEAFLFLKLCQARDLNPFLREAYLIKYGNDPAQMVVGKDAFARKAELHPMYAGYEGGIIILKGDGSLERRDGTFSLPDENTVGGWCKVYRKDREKPVLSEVAFHEYVGLTREGKPNKIWNKIPNTMIAKVAFCQGHRAAFPGLFVGMYDQAELGCEIIEAEFTVEAETSA